MKRVLFTILTACTLCFGSFEAKAQQQQEPEDVTVTATKEADKLCNLLDLEDWQLFYVDSTLQHNYKAMETEFKNLSDSKVSNLDLYFRVQDKWKERTDSLYKTIFTEEQWNRYLKSGAAREIKAREKRKAKMEAALTGEKKKK